MSLLDNATPAEWDRARDRQVGGQHYKGMSFQPIDYILGNNLGFCEGNIVKYVTRYALKGGKQDIEKARHYCDLLLEQLDRKAGGQPNVS